MREGRLSAQSRVLCLLGPMWAIGLLGMAWFVVPFLWRREALGWLTGRTCVFRALTGVPCPFCGTTRAVVLAGRGLWVRSLQMNPLGVLLVAGAPLVALWLGLCAATGRDLGLRRVGSALGRRGAVYVFLAALAALWICQVWLATAGWPGAAGKILP